MTKTSTLANADVLVRPSIGKQKEYPDLILTVIHAQERDAPKARSEVFSSAQVKAPFQQLPC
jgi:hypothetical protein